MLSLVINLLSGLIGAIIGAVIVSLVQLYPDDIKYHLSYFRKRLALFLSYKRRFIRKPGFKEMYDIELREFKEKHRIRTYYR